MSASNHPPLVRRIALRGPSSIAVRIARLFPCIQVLAFDDNWDSIDRARLDADRLGLADRVKIHHVSAAPPGLDNPGAGLRPRRAA